jgi:hypothetical protein
MGPPSPSLRRGRLRMDANVSVERFAATISVNRGYFLRSLSASAVWDLMRVNSGAFAVIFGFVSFGSLL